MKNNGEIEKQKTSNNYDSRGKMSIYKSPKNNFFVFTYILLLIQIKQNYMRVVSETNTHKPKIKDWLVIVFKKTLFFKNY